MLRITTSAAVSVQTGGSYLRAVTGIASIPIGNAELYRRLKARRVVVSGHYFFPGFEADDWPHKRECIRISYADDRDRIERGLTILVEEVRRARDGDGFSSHDDSMTSV